MSISSAKGLKDETSHTVLYTMDQLGGAACVNVKIPWWWHPEICWNV